MIEYPFKGFWAALTPLGKIVVLAGLIVILGIAAQVLYWSEIRLLACVVDSRLTDPPGVRTDGLCYFIYLVGD